MKKITISMVLMLFSVLNFAQNITGFVKNATTKEPIENVVIKIKNSNVFTTTNKNGKFIIKANLGDLAEVSILGYETQNISITNQMLIYIKEQPFSLENIIIKTEDISQATIINNEEKRLTQPRNVADMFGDIPGFALVKRSTYAIDPVLRSFSEEQLNIQYDGGMKTTNACPNRMDPVTTHISPEEVEKIEVIRGPFAVRFGSNFGGVINLQSKSAASYKEGVHGMLETGYESNGNSAIGRGSVLYKKNKFNFSTNIEYRGYGNFKDGNNNEVPSSFEALDISVKTGYDITKKQHLQLTLRETFAKNIKHAGLPMDSPKDDSYLAGLDYSFQNISPIIKGLKTKIYYSYVDHVMDNFDRPSFVKVAARSPVQSTMYGGKIEMHLKPSEKITVYTGVDLENKARDGKNEKEIKLNMMGMPLTPHIFITKDIWQQGFVNDLGFYADVRFKLKNNFKVLTGVRTDFINAGVDKPNAMFASLLGKPIASANETNFSGYITLKKHIDNGEIQFSFGSGTRTATMTERYVYRFTLGNDPYELVGNPDLKPERNNQFEFSISKNYTNFKVGGNLFYSFMNNLIIGKVDPTTPATGMSMMPFVKRFVNINNATQYGGEFFLDIQLATNWKAHTDVSYVYAQNNDWNQPLAQIAPLRSHLNIKYNNQNFWLLGEGKFVADQDRFAPQSGEQRTPGYGIFNIKTGYKLNDQFIIGASLLNIFDRAYADHMNFSYKNSSLNSGRVLEMGRNLTAQITFKF